MKKFSSTMEHKEVKRVLVNNDRILFVERLEEQYVVHFDTGQILELDARSGDLLVDVLEIDGILNMPPPQLSVVPYSSHRPPRRR